MSLKKILCNPPAERMAESGDPVVLGLFQGAGAGAYQITEEPARTEFVRAVTEVEAYYISERRKLAYKVEGQMHKIFETVAPPYHAPGGE